MNTIIVISGGVNFTDREFIEEVLVSVVEEAEHIPLFRIKQGKYPDSIIKEWCKEYNVPFVEYARRYHDPSLIYYDVTFEFSTMLHEADMVLTFPGGQGTDHLIILAKSKGVPIIALDHKMYEDWLADATRRKYKL